MHVDRMLAGQPIDIRSLSPFPALARSLFLLQETIPTTFSRQTKQEKIQFPLAAVF